MYSWSIHETYIIFMCFIEQKYVWYYDIITYILLELTTILADDIGIQGYF